MLSTVANNAADDDYVHLCTQTVEISKPLRRAVHAGALERKFLKHDNPMCHIPKSLTVSSPSIQLTKTVEIGLFCTTF